MIAVDTNILVYAHRSELPRHEVARRRLRELARGRTRWGLPVFCLGEFLRVVTHRRLFKVPHTPAEAVESIRRLMASPSVELLRPSASYDRTLLEVVESSGASGNLIFDAQIVVLCKEAGVTRLLTEDRDFDRFEGFRTERLPSR